MTGNDDIVTKAIESLETSGAALELYKDLLQPAAREIGANLLTVAKSVSVAIAPLKGAVWGFEQIGDWLCVKLTEKLAHTPPDQIHAPKMSIAGPALVNLQFCKDEDDLRELYANLLASSMDETVSDSVHPSFVHIIQQLNPDEAKILRWLAVNFNSPQVCYQITDSMGSLLDRSESAETTMNTIATHACLDRPKEINSYFDNLLRLKIFDEQKSHDTEYVEGGANRSGDYGPSVSTKSTFEIIITNFGERFIKCCVDP